MASTADLMKQFYGIVDEDSAEQPPDPTDIDGNVFEPEPFYRQLIQKNGLSYLVQKDKQVKAEMTDLDSELQNLVYNNYTKFLLAEETIRSMSDGLSSLSAKMQNVLDSLSSVSKQSAEIQKDLNPNREKIQRLVGINRLLERIDFISQLPLKLKAHADLGEYDAAIDTWLKAEKVLETQTHFESFIRIRDECKSILEDVKVKVHAVMINQSTPPKGAVTAAASLLKLQMPVDSTVTELVKFRLHQEISKLEKEKLPKGIFDLLEYLNTNVAESANEFLAEYARQIQRFVPLKAKQTSDIYITSYRKALNKKIIEIIKEDDIWTMNCETFANFINKFTVGVGKIFSATQNESYSLTILQRYIHNRFHDLIESLTEQVSKADSSSDCDSTFNEILSNFKRSVSALMNELDFLSRSNRDAKDHILQEAAGMFSQMFDEFERIDPRYSLLAFGILHQFSEHTIPLVFELVSRFDPSSPVLRMREVLCSEAEKAAARSLLMFVNTKRMMLSEMIAQGMTATVWLDARTPHDVSITSCLVMQELSLIWWQLDKIIGRVRDGSVASSQSSRSSRNQLSHFSAQSSSNTQTPLFHGLRDDNVIQIDRLFTNLNHLHLSSPPEFSAKNVITSITMYVLKTMLEFIRMDTFSCAGFNQMQVDAYFIYMTLFDKVDQQGLFNTLIEELLSSTADRTISPIPFKMVVLSEIYSRSEKKPHQKDML